MDKRLLRDQLFARIQESAGVAQRERDSAAVEAREGATPAEKREDARVALENASLAKGQSLRAERALAELSILEKFEPPVLRRGSPIALGAVVEVEGEDDARTFFLAPVGAGIELHGPGGDGFLSVVTPASPLGAAVIGLRVGDSFEVVVNGAA